MAAKLSVWTFAQVIDLIFVNTVSCSRSFFLA